MEVSAPAGTSDFLAFAPPVELSAADPCLGPAAAAIEQHQRLWNGREVRRGWS
jgi:hypothetical protein